VEEPSSPSLSELTQDSEVAPTETATKDGAVIKTVNVKDKTMSEDTSSIMEFSTSLADAEAPPPIPVGEYPARVVKAEIKVSKSSGNRYLALMLRIEPESYPADFENGNPEGETFSYNRMVLVDAPRERYRLRKFNEALGAPNGSKIDANDYMDLVAMVGVAHGSWEGETRAEIAKVMKA